MLPKRYNVTSDCGKKLTSSGRASRFGLVLAARVRDALTGVASAYRGTLVGVMWLALLAKFNEPPGDPRPIRPRQSVQRSENVEPSTIGQSIPAEVADIDGHDLRHAGLGGHPVERRIGKVHVPSATLRVSLHPGDDVAEMLCPEWVYDGAAEFYPAQQFEPLRDREQIACLDDTRPGREQA